jgi:hypothetical protein
VPIALASFGFSVYIGILAIPMLLIAVIVWANPVFEGSQRDIEELSAPA